jgi:hydroxymethylpyrimidine pyrophosphatase-like HAD family hydrolase
MTFPKLFITDLDGTALGGNFEPYVQFPEPFCQFLDRLSDKGCKWAINTTWDVDGQWDLVMSSPVKSRPTYLMAEFGLRMAEVNGEGYAFIQPYTEDNNRELATFNNEIGYKIISDICSKFRASKMMFYGHLFDFTSIPEDGTALASYVKEHYASMPEIVMNSNKNRFSFRPAFLNKGTAVKKLMQLAGLSSAEVIAAGDETADIGMIQEGSAEFLIGPENSAPKVKQAIVENHGEIGTGHACLGIIDAFNKLAAKQGWDW